MVRTGSVMEPKIDLIKEPLSPFETFYMLKENGFPAVEARTRPPGCIGASTLNGGEVVYLYRSGKALVQGTGELGDVREVLRSAGWSVK